MKNIFTAGFLLFTIVVFSQRQTEPEIYCGTVKHMENMKQLYGYNALNEAEDAAYEDLMQQAQVEGYESYQRGGQTIYVIPIVFNIVHVGGQENISDLQVFDAIRILNEDFNRLNPDTTDVVASFENNVADVGFEFRLAQKDALGACVRGINRIYSATTFDGDNGMVDKVNQTINGNTSTANTHFPRNKYLNIWVCAYAGGAAGYTNTPNNWTPAKYDGIWILHNYIGSIGTSNLQRSRALTHEVGHWFNLRHTWGNTNNPGCTGQPTPPCNGDDNCTTDDNVTDTPNTIGWTSCNLNGATCGSPIDNVQNFMEYSYCSRMFTNGQKTRLRTAATSSTGQRNQLWTTTNLNNSGTNGTNIFCGVDFEADDYIICAGDSITFYDLSYHGASTWNWTFTGGTTADNTVQNPVVYYNTPGLYDVTLLAGDGSTTLSNTKTQYVRVLPATGLPLPYSESFETVTAIPGSEWSINNPDGLTTWQLQSGVAYTGNKSVKLNNYSYIAGNTDELISTTIDLSNDTNVTVSFKYAYAMKATGDNDKLIFSISDNCGETWSPRKQLNGLTLSTSANTTSAFTPASQLEWKEALVQNTTSEYYVPNFRFKFDFQSDGGNNIYIDDINIYSTITGIQEADEFVRLNVYPNPADDVLTLVYYTSGKTDVTFELVDVIGKQVSAYRYPDVIAGDHISQISLSEFPAGVYFIRMLIGKETVTKKIVISRQ